MISVVMPAYNTEKYIGAAIESILKQTYEDFEFIIVDDGSTDKTLEIIQEYAQKDNRIKVVHSQHAGASGAVNRGILAAQREWIAIMHSDDISLPTRLERQLEAAQNEPGVVIWGTDGYHITSRNTRLSVFQVGPGSQSEYEEMFKSGALMQVIHPTALMRREIIIKAGLYDTKMKFCEDIDLFDRMLDYGEIRTVREPLLEYRIHATSLTMLHFLKQKRWVDYITKRRKYRAMGREISFEEFESEYLATTSRYQRLRETMTEFSRMFYRSTGMAIGDRLYLKALRFGVLAVLTDPLYVVRRAWQQFMSPRARQALKGAKKKTPVNSSVVTER